MNNEKNNQIIHLLQELVKWTKFQAWGKVKDVLLSILDDDEKKKIYHLSNGENSSRKIGNSIVGGKGKVIRNWNDWAKSNIVEPIPVKGGGLRYKKMFNLEDFGIDVPKLG